MKLGVTSNAFQWSFGKEGYPRPAAPFTLPALVEWAGQCGLSVVQAAENCSPDELPYPEFSRLATLLKSTGVTLELASGVDPLQLDDRLALCRKLGVRCVRAFLGMPGHTPSADTAAAMLRESAGAYEAAGVVIAVENHFLYPPRAVLRVLDAVSSPAVRCALDTGNCIAAGEGPVEAARDLRDYIVEVHAKDFACSRAEAGADIIIRGAPLGHGLLDLRRVLEVTGGDVTVLLDQWAPYDGDIDDAAALEQAWAQQGAAYLKGVMA